MKVIFFTTHTPSNRVASLNFIEILELVFKTKLTDTQQRSYHHCTLRTRYTYICIICVQLIGSVNLNWFVIGRIMHGRLTYGGASQWRDATFNFYTSVNLTKSLIDSVSAWIFMRDRFGDIFAMFMETNAVSQRNSTNIAIAPKIIVIRTVNAKEKKYINMCFCFCNDRIEFQRRNSNRRYRKKIGNSHSQTEIDTYVCTS